jgi:hypothetical protein
MQEPTIRIVVKKASRKHVDKIKLLASLNRLKYSTILKNDQSHAKSFNPREYRMFGGDGGK